MTTVPGYFLPFRNAFIDQDVPGPFKAADNPALSPARNLYLVPYLKSPPLIPAIASSSWLLLDDSPASAPGGELLRRETKCFNAETYSGLNPSTVASSVKDSMSPFPER